MIERDGKNSSIDSLNKMQKPNFDESLIRRKVPPVLTPITGSFLLYSQKFLNCLFFNKENPSFLPDYTQSIRYEFYEPLSFFQNKKRLSDVCASKIELV